MPGLDLQADLSEYEFSDLREGDVTAIDTETELTTKGSQTAPGVLKRSGPISLVIITVASSSGGVGSAGAFVRIRGSGFPEIVLPVGAFGGTLATGGLTPGMITAFKVNFNPTGDVRFFGEMVGVDVGQLHISVAVYG